MKTLFSMEAAKFWVAAVAAIIITGLEAYEAVMGGGVTPQEWITVTVAILGAVLVYTTRNKVPAKE